MNHAHHVEKLEEESMDPSRFQGSLDVDDVAKCSTLIELADQNLRGSRDPRNQSFVTEFAKSLTRFLKRIHVAAAVESAIENLDGAASTANLFPRFVGCADGILGEHALTPPAKIGARGVAEKGKPICAVAVSACGVRSISHCSPYDRVREVNADP